MSEPDLRAWMKTLVRRACPTCHGSGYLGMTAIKCYTCPTVEAKIREAFTYAAQRARQQAEINQKLVTRLRPGEVSAALVTGAKVLNAFAAELEALGQGVQGNG